jgi:PAP2 superfamily
MRTKTTLLTTAVAALTAGAVAITFAVLSHRPTTTTAASASIADTAGSGRSVADWNAMLITILGTPNAQPSSVHPTRSFAMLHAAEYNAVVSITHALPPYRAVVPAGGDARPDAAADQAAHDVLMGLYPTMRAQLDNQLAAELATLPAGAPTEHGLAVGTAAARAILADRADDGSMRGPVPFVAGNAPGEYRPTPPKFGAPMYVGWGSVRPFLLDNPDQFHPSAPPPVNGADYAAALAEVKEIGRDSSSTRTPDQTVAGKFWSAAPVWNTWNQLAQRLTADQDASLTQASRVFSALDLALADTTIALYDAKYEDNVWRPVTAIRQGLPAASPPVAEDPSWNPLTPTAADPSYPGAHSALSVAAATVLSAFYGPQEPVTITTAADPGVVRSFPNLAAAADEAGLSRIWSGQHTRLDHQAGQQLGREVAGQVLADLEITPNTR